MEENNHSPSDPMPKSKSSTKCLSNSSPWHAGGEKKVSDRYRHWQILQVAIVKSDMKELYPSLNLNAVVMFSSAGRWFN